MEIKSTTKHARFSAKKGRDVAREIVGLPVSDAIDILTYTPKKAAFLINKTLKTAVADAENNFNLDADTLFVKEAAVTVGSIMRRFKPRARGSASAIRKRTSHIMVTVEAGEVSEATKKRKEKQQKKALTPKTETSSPQVTQEPVEFTSEVKEEAPKAGESRVDEKLGLVYTSAPSEVDDLTKISGVGPVLAQKLNEKGFYMYKQVMEWTPEIITEIDELLSFKGRIDRENWLDQAQSLQKEKYEN